MSSEDDDCVIVDHAAKSRAGSGTDAIGTTTSATVSTSTSRSRQPASKLPYKQRSWQAQSQIPTVPTLQPIIPPPPIVPRWNPNEKFKSVANSAVQALSVSHLVSTSSQSSTSNTRPALNTRTDTIDSNCARLVDCSPRSSRTLPSLVPTHAVTAVSPPTAVARRRKRVRASLTLHSQRQRRRANESVSPVTLSEEMDHSCCEGSDCPGNETCTESECDTCRPINAKKARFGQLPSSNPSAAPPAHCQSQTQTKPAEKRETVHRTIWAYVPEEESRTCMACMVAQSRSSFHADQWALAKDNSQCLQCEKNMAGTGLGSRSLARNRRGRKQDSPRNGSVNPLMRCNEVDGVRHRQRRSTIVTRFDPKQDLEMQAALALALDLERQETEAAAKRATEERQREEKERHREERKHAQRRSRHRHERLRLRILRMREQAAADAEAEELNAEQLRLGKLRQRQARRASLRLRDEIHINPYKRIEHAVMRPHMAEEELKNPCNEESRIVEELKGLELDPDILSLIRTSFGLNDEDNVIHPVHIAANQRNEIYERMLAEAGTLGNGKVYVAVSSVKMTVEDPKDHHNCEFDEPVLATSGAASTNNRMDNLRPMLGLFAGCDLKEGDVVTTYGGALVSILHALRQPKRTHTHMRRIRDCDHLRDGRRFSLLFNRLAVDMEHEFSLHPLKRTRIGVSCTIETILRVLINEGHEDEVRFGLMMLDYERRKEGNGKRLLEEYLPNSEQISPIYPTKAHQRLVKAINYIATQTNVCLDYQRAEKFLIGEKKDSRPIFIPHMPSFKPFYQSARHMHDTNDLEDSALGYQLTSLSSSPVWSLEPQLPKMFVHNNYHRSACLMYAQPLLRLRALLDLGTNLCQSAHNDLYSTCAQINRVIEEGGLGYMANTAQQSDWNVKIMEVQPGRPAIYAGEVFYIATRAIKRGEEIFAPYNNNESKTKFNKAKAVHDYQPDTPVKASNASRGNDSTDTSSGTPNRYQCRATVINLDHEDEEELSGFDDDLRSSPSPLPMPSLSPSASPSSSSSLSSIPSPEPLEPASPSFAFGSAQSLNWQG